MTPKDIQFRAEAAEASAIITDNKGAAKFDQVRGECPTVTAAIVVEPNADMGREGWVSYAQVVDEASLLLLFTAAIVSNIESVQQTLNVTLEAAYVHVFIPVEALIWVRSGAIILLIVAHALRHVHSQHPQRQETTALASPPAPIVITPELVDALRALLTQTIITEETNRPQELPSPQEEHEVTVTHAARANKEGEQGANNKAVEDSDDEPGGNNYERVKAYLAIHPDAKVREVAGALTISVSTANKWMVRIKGEGL